jgi:hypothetical protein
MRLLLPLLLLNLSGCATLAKLITPAAQPFLQVSVDVAVATAVGNNAATQKARAVQIKAIAADVLTLDTGTQVALSAIQAVVNAKVVALHLPPADLAAAQLLTATLSAVIQTKLNGTAAGQVTAATQVAISDVCNDVISATSAYGA